MTNKEAICAIVNNWNELSFPEFKRFLRVLYLISVYRGKNEPVVKLWCKETGRICKALSKKIFSNFAFFTI